MKKELISNWTRTQLMNSLFSLMRQKPLDKISVKEVSERCGIPRSTFYYHFEDIYDLASYAMATRLLECLEEDGTCVLWGKGLLELFRRSRQHYDVCRCAINSSRLWQMADSYCSRCMSGIMVGLRQLDGDRHTDEEFLRFLGVFYGHGVLSALVTWFRGDMRQPEEEICAALDFFVRDNITSTLDKLAACPGGAPAAITGRFAM